MEGTSSIQRAPLSLEIRQLESSNDWLKEVVKFQLELSRDKTAQIDRLIDKLIELDDKLEKVTKERDDYKELFFSYKHVCGSLPPEVIEELVTKYKVGEKKE